MPRVLFIEIQGEIGVAFCDAKSLSTTQPKAMTLSLMIKGNRKYITLIVTTYDYQFPIFDESTQWVMGLVWDSQDLLWEYDFFCNEHEQKTESHTD